MAYLGELFQTPGQASVVRSTGGAGGGGGRHSGSACGACSLKEKSVHDSAVFVLSAFRDCQFLESIEKGPEGIHLNKSGLVVL